MKRYTPYDLRSRANDDMDNSNQNSIPPPPPNPNPLPLPIRNMPQNQNQNAQNNGMLDQVERIMKSLQTPQAVRELQPFDGNPTKLHSFIRAVENLIPFIEPLKGSPYEKIWLQAIRAKIINEADQVLETYGTALNWDDIKENLIAYYNDKRDPVTLTRELFQIQQINSIEEFFGKIQNLLSLLINHTNISTNNENLKQDRILTHQENALQVFLAGLKEPIGGNVRARQPRTIKQAFDAAIEERNFQSRGGLNKPNLQPNLPARPPKAINFPPQLRAHRPAPYNQFYNRPPMPYPQYSQRPNFAPQYAPPNNDNSAPRAPPRALPAPEARDVDRSIRSKFVNYMNRPNDNSQRQSFSQRNRFVPAVPPRTARITELRNIEQDYGDSYEQSTYNDPYYEHSMQSNYFYPDYYYETPYATTENYPNYTSTQHEADNENEPVDDNTEQNNEKEFMDNLNFQVETNFHPPR